jgi:hypothetical protein
MILFINQNNDRLPFFGQRLGYLDVIHDDDMVASVKQACGSAIGLNDTRTGFPGDEIRFQASPVLNIHHLNQFEGMHAGGFKQVGINREAAFIVYVRAGYHGPVDFRS